jgi:hypothetical protein
MSQVADRPVTDTQAALRLRFQAEIIAQCRFGVESLMEDHGKEFTYFKDTKGKVDPDWDLARRVELDGNLRILTARDEGHKLVAYFMYVLRQSPHYRGAMEAVEDTFYMAREARGRNGRNLLKFLKYAVTHMENSGVRYICVTSKAKADLTAIWKRFGLELEECRYTKIVPKLQGAA